jgi:rhodanese-related sulfurtransferase
MEITMSKKHHETRSTSSEPGTHSHRKDRKQNLTGMWIGLGIVILVTTAFLIFRPKSTLPTEISAAQAYEKYQQGAFFLDVRTQAEWDQGHIAKSTLIPLDSLQARLNELPQDQDIVVICRSGARSKEGAAILRQAGFTRVTCMTGGLQAWVAAGYTLTN